MGIEETGVYFGAFVKAASPELMALLSSTDQFIMADLYTITLVGGSVLRYSATPTALSVNGVTFTLGPKFERSKTKIVIGTQVDELEVRIYTEPTDVIGRMPFLQAAWQGQLDGALLQLERAFMATYGDTSPGAVVLFSGRISDIECTRTAVDIKCRSHLELLNIQMPRRLWQSSCTHTFLYSHLRRRDVSVRPIGRAGGVLGRARLDSGANCNFGDPSRAEHLYPRNPTWCDRSKCRVEPHGCKYGRRVGLREAGLFIARSARRPIPAAPGMRPHTLDLFECL
jgi:hypothetical protein